MTEIPPVGKARDDALAKALGLDYSIEHGVLVREPFHQVVGRVSTDDSAAFRLVLHWRSMGNWFEDTMSPDGFTCSAAKQYRRWCQPESDSDYAPAASGAILRAAEWEMRE